MSMTLGGLPNCSCLVTHSVRVNYDNHSKTSRRYNVIIVHPCASADRYKVAD
jgi:hypothetical protein